jgi:hypothetical protein
MRKRRGSPPTGSRPFFSFFVATQAAAGVDVRDSAFPFLLNSFSLLLDLVNFILQFGYSLNGGVELIFTRRQRYPLIVDALASLRVQSIMIDGEAVWCGEDGKTRPSALSPRSDASPCVSSIDGMAKPSALQSRKLTTNSNLMGA